MISYFQGANRFLSNFWPCEVYLDGVLYPSVENAYQAAKTVGDRGVFFTCTAGQAKKLGKKVDIRSDWEDVKLQVMEDLVRMKFLSNELANKLLATGDQELVEGNTWGDTFWGVCGGKGQNHLGKILMKVRQELKDGINP